MYRLYHKIPKGLEPILNTFKQHVTNEVTVLVQQAEDAASNQATTSSGAPEQVLIRKLIELHDKYMVYVTDCFSNNTLFHKALKEAFEVFCNRTVAGVSSSELLATFCDNILKKGGSEKLGDEAIEETLEKVVKLLAYISDKDLYAEFYRKKLARRLLLDCSANHDHERNISTKLKQQCGEQFTSKEGMGLPSLGEKHDEFMPRELGKRWSSHKVMVWWLLQFFYYLDRYFIARSQRSLPALNEVGLTCFCDLVCDDFFLHLMLILCASLSWI
ncbi:hypothetical protein SLEP1_g1251 [Rubroshorea leprosula]|uniref:Cullin family profile domain-containing protein n=1 Tax=Rubroshorea leprosula TaxID=152421 RepID=A0AAV5HHV9_9ROSI|nr:hypothetical protein SLEP1_g1251 [Rubroshorea leprosula]